jgi:hypothetical protein
MHLYQRHRAWLFLALAFAGIEVRADVQRIVLPRDYADFALNPETGDLVAVAAETGEAFLFRVADLEAGKTEPAAKARVGPTACAVFFKRYQDVRVFAVVCTQDAHMYCSIRTIWRS